MKEIKIIEDEVGIDYLNAIEKAIAIRKQRRTIYGDKFMEDSVQFLLLTIENKMKRLKGNIENNIVVNNVENAEDSILDAVNYLLFLDCVIRPKKQLEFLEGYYEPEIIKMKHKVNTDYYTETDEFCDGEVYWDEGVEGYVCTKCNLYTGVK